MKHQRRQTRTEENGVNTADELVGLLSQKGQTHRPTSFKTPDKSHTI